jgi:hypothetical protein
MVSAPDMAESILRSTRDPPSLCKAARPRTRTARKALEVGTDRYAIGIGSTGLRASRGERRASGIGRMRESQTREPSGALAIARAGLACRLEGASTRKRRLECQKAHCDPTLSSSRHPHHRPMRERQVKCQTRRTRILALMEGAGRASSVRHQISPEVIGVYKSSEREVRGGCLISRT